LYAGAATHQCPFPGKSIGQLTFIGRARSRATSKTAGRAVAFDEPKVPDRSLGAAVQPRALLAAVIVLDQFSRNLFHARCFHGRSRRAPPVQMRDQSGVRYGHAEQERQFLYMPFEHSEERADQALAVQLIGSVGNAEWT